MAKLILFNKPFNTLSQFTDKDGRNTLGDFLTEPDCKACYAAGRLDYDSEGLMLLTDDGQLQNQITSPKAKCFKTYWAQVEGEVDELSLERLRKGVELKDGLTAPAKAKSIVEPNVWPRNPPIRERSDIPTSWLELSISEGKNRQVRRMTAAVGLPTLRLIRVQIGQWRLEDLLPGEYKIEKVNMPRPETRPKSRKSKHQHRQRKS